MRLFRLSKATFIAVMVLSCSEVSTISAHAGSILELSYSGTIIEVQDTFGVFSGIAVGDAANGVLKYSTPAPLPLFEYFGTSYTFDTAPGGGNGMTISTQGYAFHAVSGLIVQVYDPPYLNSVFGFDAAGYDMQFIEDAAGLLDASVLPTGYRYRNLFGSLSFLTTNVNSSPYPDLPSSLLPLADYDALYGTLAGISVEILDANGDFVELAGFYFSIDSVTMVPEPSTAFSTSLGLVLGVLVLRRSVSRSLGGDPTPTH